MNLPTKDEALQFAIMLKAGLPARDAIVYFAQGDDPSSLAQQLSFWLRSKSVRDALTVLEGKPWQKMSLKEKMEAALDQHYAGLAYFIYSNNYSDLGKDERMKADTARTALEAKVAGNAGKMSALDEFFTDFKAGKLNLKKPLIDILPEQEH
jgi:hypothetical protein